jgi:hypothetical protein
VPSFEGLFKPVGEAQFVLLGHNAYEKHYNPEIEAHQHHYSDLSFQGSVLIGDKEFDVRTLQNYRLTKQDNHPDVTAALGSSLVIS